MAKLSTSKTLNLQIVAEKIKWWFESKNWETRLLDLDGSYYIKARKASWWRSTIGADRALQIGVHRNEDGGTRVEVKQGDWTTNIVSNAAWLILTGGTNAVISGWSFVLQKQAQRYIREVLDNTLEFQESSIKALPDRSGRDDELHKKVRSLENYSDSPDFWGDKIPEKKLTNARQTHKRHNDYIFFLSDTTIFGSANESILITDKGISFKCSSSTPALFLSWESIDSIEFNEKVGQIRSNGKLYTFGMYQKVRHEEFEELLVELSNKEISQFSNDLKELREKVHTIKNSAKENLDHDFLEAAIVLCDKLLNRCRIFPDEQYYYEEKHIAERDSFEVTYFRAVIFWLVGKAEQAKEELFLLVKKREENNISIDEELFVSICELIAEISLTQQQSDHAIVFLSKANKTGSPSTQRKVKALLREITQKRANLLLEEPCESRQVIFCTNDIPSWITKEFCFVRADVLRSTEWKFEIGHPQSETFYVCHPLRPNRYFSLAEFHDKVFDDKHAELVYLLQSIGTNHIHVEAGRNILEKNSSIENKELSGTDEIIATLSVQDQSKGIRRQAGQSGIWDIALQPTRKPHIPTDLVWYYHEPTWQRIAKSALTGSYKKVTLELHYQEDFSINEKRIRQIEGGLSLFYQKEGIQWSKETEERLQQRKKTIWKFTASFPESIEQNISQTLMENLTEQEVDYKEELEDCLADGIISDDERRILERRKHKLGIDEARASELEIFVKKNLHIT